MRTARCAARVVYTNGYKSSTSMMIETWKVFAVLYDVQLTFCWSGACRPAEGRPSQALAGARTHLKYNVQPLTCH